MRAFVCVHALLPVWVPVRVSSYAHAVGMLQGQHLTRDRETLRVYVRARARACVRARTSLSAYARRALARACVRAACVH